MSKEKIERTRFRGRTVAYRRFVDRTFWNKELLKVGLLGLKQQAIVIDQVVEKFKPVKGIPGPIPKNYEPDLSMTKTSEGTFELTADMRTATILRKAVKQGKEKFEGLKYHLNAILAVDLWGAFETYNTMLFEELFIKKPELLISDEKISIAEAVKNRDSIMKFLVERQIGAIGHFSVNDLIKFTEKKLKFSYTPSQATKLTSMYLIRNIIAHNTGIVRPSYVPHLPTTIKVIKNELRLSDAYLKFMSRNIEACVIRVEKHVITKFFT